MSDPEPIVIGLTATEAQSAHYALRDLIARRGLEKRPLPRRFYTLQARLVSFVRETETCAPKTHSASSAEGELIDTAEAAAIIDRSPQWVRRIRAELGGRDIGGRYVFSRQTVVQYAERKAGHHK